jgi:hypothetical protein
LAQIIMMAHYTTSANIASHMLKLVTCWWQTTIWPGSSKWQDERLAKKNKLILSYLFLLHCYPLW